MKLTNKEETILETYENRIIKLEKYVDTIEQEKYNKVVNFVKRNLDSMKCINDFGIVNFTSYYCKDFSISKSNCYMWCESSYGLTNRVQLTKKYKEKLFDYIDNYFEEYAK